MFLRVVCLVPFGFATEGLELVLAQGRHNIYYRPCILAIWFPSSASSPVVKTIFCLRGRLVTLFFCCRTRPSEAFCAWAFQLAYVIAGLGYSLASFHSVIYESLVAGHAAKPLPLPNAYQDRFLCQPKCTSGGLWMVSVSRSRKPGPHCLSCKLCWCTPTTPLLPFLSSRWNLFLCQKSLAGWRHHPRMWVAGRGLRLSPATRMAGLRWDPRPVGQARTSYSTGSFVPTLFFQS